MGTAISFNKFSVSTISRIIEKYWWVIYLVVFVLGLFWLSVTPVVNNDEFWFGDAAKQIAQCTGYDVKIYPELYQGIKANKLIGFSMLQAIAIQLLGFNLFALRIVSYLCVFIAGWMFFLLAKQKEFNKAHLMPFVLVLNPYVWHVGHVGRPEAILLRLPLFFGLDNLQAKEIISIINKAIDHEFYKQ